MYLDNVYSRSKLFTSAFTFSLHSTSKHLVSFCFFIKQMLDSVRIPSHSSPSRSTRTFSPFPGSEHVSLMATQAAARPLMGMGKSWNPVLNTLQHLCCCHSPGTGPQSWQQPCCSTRSPLNPQVLLPHGAGSSPPHRQRQAGQQVRLASGTEGRWAHREETETSEVLALPVLILSLIP